MKKVLFLCKGHPNIAGAQLYLKTVADIFPSNDYELHYAFCSSDGMRVFDEISRSRIIFKWEYDWRHLGFWLSLKIGLNLFKKIAPDIIIFNTSDYRVLGSIWASFLAGIERRVMIVHWSQSPVDLPLFRRKCCFHIPIPSRYSIQTRILRGLTFNLLSKLIFVNSMTRKAYKKLYGVPLSKSVTIHNGIDINAFSPLTLKHSRVRIRTQLGAGPDDIIVFAAGNLTEVKGHRYLINAMYLLKQRRLAVKCWIAGQGELREQLEKMASSLDLNKKCCFLGYQDDILSLLGSSDIFCMPSLNEGLPYSLLEAMSAGLPVVASNVGGIPEVVTNGREGFLVPPMDPKALAGAIEVLASNIGLRKRMGISARETVKERFSIDKMLQDTKRILLGCMN